MVRGLALALETLVVPLCWLYRVLGQVILPQDNSTIALIHERLETALKTIITRAR